MSKRINLEVCSFCQFKDKFGRFSKNLEERSDIESQIISSYFTKELQKVTAVSRFFILHF